MSELFKYGEYFTKQGNIQAKYKKQQIIPKKNSYLNCRSKYESDRNKLGEGGFGFVHKVIEKSTGRVFAAKFIKDKKKGRVEACFLAELKNDNILR